MNLLILLEPEAGSIFFAFPPLDTAVLGVNHETLVARLTDKPNRRRSARRAKLPGEVVYDAKAGVNILAKRSKQNAGHEKFGSEKIGFGFEHAPSVVAQVGFRAEEHLRILAVLLPMAQFVGDGEATRAKDRDAVADSHDPLVPFPHQTGRRTVESGDMDEDAKRHRGILQLKLSGSRDGKPPVKPERGALRPNEVRFRW